MGRKLAFLLLSFLLFSLALPILHVHAQEAATLELTADKPCYYLKGEPMTINATGNASAPVTLSVYWNWRTLQDNELVYQNTKTLNASWTLPTVNQRPGFYRIEANMTETTVTIWRTLIHTSSYQVAALPFSHEWQGINYTVQGRTFRAETPDDFIEIVYPKIPFLHNTRFYQNNMTFLVRLDGDGWAVDVIYMTIHAGLKWRINGTLDNPQTFEFECSHNPLRTWKQRLDRFQSDNFLVFDWDDLRKAGEAFTWNPDTKTLSVTIPSSFDIDPYIFEDGFEGTFPSPWDDNGISGTTNSFSTDVAHHGSQSHKVAGLDGGDDYGYVAEAVTSGTKYFCREYVQFTALSLNDGARCYMGPMFASAGGSTLCAPYLYRSGASYGWGVAHRTTGGHQYHDAGTESISADTWYCLEISQYIDGSNGYVTLWVEGVLKVNATGLDTNDYGNIGRCESAFWLVAGSATSFDAYGDCHVTDTAYIGPEDEGQDLTFTLAQNITVLASLARTIELQRFLIANPSMLSSLTTNKERPVTLTETAPFYASLSKGVEFGNLLTGAVGVFAYLATTIELSVLDLSFTLSETVQPLATILVGKELSRTFPGVVTFLSSLETATEGIALELSVILFEVVTVYASLASEVGFLTLELVFALAGLGFILALVAFVLVLAKRRQD